MTTTLLSLPFEVHLIIARHLNLKDALSYAEVSPTIHDVIYYIFAHRLQLDFSSTLNSSGVINLPDDTIMRILHAHTRAAQLCYFALSPTFQLNDQLKFYLDLYWNCTFIPDYAENLEPLLLGGTYIGHQSGQLQNIGYVRTLNDETYSLLQSYDDPVYGIHIESEPTSPMLTETVNWSTADIDKPYSECTICGQTIQPIPQSTTRCSSCNEVQNYNESDKDES